MGRKILALVVALIAAVATISIGQMLMGLVWKPPADFMADQAVQKAFVAGLPTEAFISLAVVYALGSFAGGFIVTKIGRQVSSGITLPVIIGIVLTIAGVFNFVSIPHPTWVAILCLLVDIPSALLGHRLAR